MPSVPPPDTDLPPSPPAPRPSPGRPRRTQLWMAPAALMLGLAAYIFSALVIESIGSAFGSPLAHPTPAVNLVVQLDFDLCFVAAALYFSFLQGRMSRAEFGYRFTGWRRGITAVLLAGGGYYVVTWLYGAILNLHGSDKLPEEFGASRSAVAFAAAAVLVCVVAPIAEEFFFRGFLFGILRRMPVRVAGRDLGPWLAAVIVGLLFGLAHTGSARSEYLIPLGFLGFVLCLMRWRTRSLYPCMALHSINNSLALGVNQAGWNVGEILLLMAGALIVVGLTTAPLAIDDGPVDLPAGAGAAAAD